MPGIVLRGGDTKMGECTRQMCACCLGVYILVMIKLVGFIGVSFLANKYLLSIYSVQRHLEYHNTSNTHSPCTCESY